MPRRPATTMLGSAVFVGAARNCARDLGAALDRWDALATLFDVSLFFVAENDSTDGTKEILARWGAGDARRRVLTLDGLDASGLTRPCKIAAARNRLLDAVRADVQARTADYLIVMDLDDASLAISPRRLARCMAFPGWDALFANQLFYYADIWALRDAHRSPDDFVHRIEATPHGWRRRLARWYHLHWRNRPIGPFRRPIPVVSAFGGFGIYRLPMALNAAYAGTANGRDICEHVPYHEALVAAGGRLFLHPALINMVPRTLLRFAPLLLGRDAIGRP
jgi:hypothetical protein